jgi:hypothetical protein
LTLARLDYLTANGLIACYHERGSDELANRALKDFGHEQLPFKRFAPNAAWYYTMLVGHFLLESFKEDVGAPVVGDRFLCLYGAQTVDRYCRQDRLPQQ